MLKPIEKKSLSDAVFEQLRTAIVSGHLEVGSTLPAERALCEMLNVNRGAVREGLKKLEQARLIATQHGGGSRVLDFRETAGLDLIAPLITTQDGRIDAEIVRGVMELRSALGADIARRCAQRSPGRAVRLKALAEQMRGESSLEALLSLNLEFWSTAVDGANNMAYRLVYNSVRDLLAQMPAAFAAMLSEETQDARTHLRIAEAIASGEVDDAEFYTRDLMSRGEARVSAVVAMFAAEEAEQTR